MNRMILLSVVLLSLVLASAASAQSELSRSYTTDDGRLTVRYPDGWTTFSSTTLILANSEGAFDRSWNDLPLEVDDVLFTFVLPTQLSKIALEADAAPEQIINTFLSLSSLSSSVDSYSALALPAASTFVSSSDLAYGQMVAVAFDGGTVFAAIEFGSALANHADVVAQILGGLSYDGQLAADGSIVPQSTGSIQPAPAETVRQWATSATGTSQYGETGWGFIQATGAPDTPACGDSLQAWASSSSTSTEMLALEFEQAVVPSQVNIYQTYNPGSITRIELTNTDTGEIIPLPDSADPPGNTPCPGVFSLDTFGVETPVNGVIIYLDQSIGGSWNEIDAVELVGTMGTEEAAGEFGEGTDAAPLSVETDVTYVVGEFPGVFTIEYPETWATDFGGSPSAIASSDDLLFMSPADDPGDGIAIQIVPPTMLAQLGVNADSTAQAAAEAISAQFESSAPVETYDLSVSAAISHLDGASAPAGAHVIAIETTVGPFVFAVRTNQFDEFEPIIKHIVESLAPTA